MLKWRIFFKSVLFIYFLFLQGWGCGYRTLQTIASWIIKNETLNKTVPSIKEIQEILVSIEDKGPSFIGSRQWIGSFEVPLIIELKNCLIFIQNNGLKLII